METALRRISRRAMLFLTLIFVIICGLALRRYGYAMHLPFVVVKYGGSVLWGAMVYALLATIVAGTKPSRIAAAALIVAVAVEFFRLVHTPWLDAFRLTIARCSAAGAGVFPVEYIGLRRWDRHRLCVRSHLFED